MNTTILERVNNVTRQLDEITALETSKSKATEVRDTLVALTELLGFVNMVTMVYLNLRARLDPERARELDSQLSMLAQNVRISHEEFAKQSRQAPQVRIMIAQAKQAQNSLYSMWRESAEAQARPLLQLLTLVQWLPEMQAIHATTEQLRARLDTRINNLPQSASVVTDFDAQCNELSSLLDNVRGISPAVRAFLARVVEGSAHIGDLTDEVLQWCRQGARSSAFRITFPTATSE